MAGYIIKATLENTHPPVWRRLVIPEKITFGDMHRILQAAFQWEDCHLHEFTVLGIGIRIGMDGEDSDGADAEEGQVLVDGFWDISKNIRYTYDFGDDWSHKISFEKEDTAYSFRCARVLKYRGDSFCEDSGGVWNADGAQARVLFELESVNQRLREMTFPVREESGESRELLKMAAVEKLWKNLSKEHRKKLFELGEELVERMGKGFEEMPEESQPSEMSKKVRRWCKFCETWETSGQENLLKNVCQKSSEELLAGLAPKESRDYCKYTGAMPEDEDDTGLCAKAVWEELERHPEYLGYIFDWEELKQLMELLKAPNMVLQELPEQDMVTKALAFGLFDLSEELVGSSRYLVLRQTAEAGGLLARHTEGEWRRISRERMRRMEKRDQLLLLYTMMELDVFCEKYREYFEKDIDREELLRCIYLGGTFRRELRTAVEREGTHYIAEYYVDMNKVLREQKDMGAELDYRVFSRQELEKMSEGYGALYPEWGEYYDYLMGCYDMDEEEAADWIREDYEDVRNGERTDVLWENIRESGMLASLDCYASFWSLFFGICLNTGIPMLKGYSRAEYADITGIPLEKTDIYRDFQAVDKVTEKTHLYEMPLELQIRLYKIIRQPVNQKSLAELEELHRGLERGNYELEYLMVSGFIAVEEYEKAERTLRRLVKVFPKDEAVRVMQDTLRSVMRYGGEEELSVWDMLDGKTLKSQTETFHRDHPKVGRNDPCPCGSGKKYKKCCGR